MINENRNTMSYEEHGKDYYSRLHSCAITSIKSYYSSSRSLLPSNNRLKLTAHLENFLSARSLA